ncbi:MAG TPA: SRPBCC family protein [Frankiaceae bacterium]|nr:SRPBCC family protein [Frankiaceae bacterium]
MKLENSFTVPVAVEQAWQVLQDVERIAPCMPGATLDAVDGDSFTGRVKVKVGPIMLTYAGKATFADKDEAAHAMTIEASGKETRGSGTAKATVHASMQADGDSTKVLLVTELAVTGKPAQFGRGVMADVSGKLIDQFAKCLGEEVQSGSSSATPAAEEAATASAAPPTPAEPAVSSVGATPSAPATPPLPPSGAPQQAAPAPATPLPAAGLPSGVSSVSSPNGAAPSSGPATPSRPRPQQAEAIDLLGTAGMPVAKRLVPVVAAVVLAIVIIRMLRRR